MVPTTRRRFLSGAVASFAALAGCNESRDARTSPESRRSENVERDPEAHVLRASSDDPIAWLPRERPGATETTDETEAETPPDHPRQRGFIADEATAERLRFGSEIDGVAAAREFVGATDFDSETVYFETRSVRECYELDLCYVTWSASEIDTQYGSYYRDAEVACDVGDRETTAWFIRVPDALDPDEVTRYGSGGSSNGCHYPPHMRTTPEETADEVVARPVTENSTGGTADTETTAEGER